MYKTASAISVLAAIWLITANCSAAEPASPQQQASGRHCGPAARHCAGWRSADQAPSASVRHESVGIGEDDPVLTMSQTYNLHMIFATQGSGEYLAEIKVLIEDSKGKKVLETESPGPIFYAQLPAGTYRITAFSHERPLHKSVTTKDGRLRDLYFYWPGE